MGSNSLKHYRVENVPGEGHRLETEKTPWRIAHSFFTHGELRPDAAREVVDAIARVTSSQAKLAAPRILCLATGVFREIRNLEPLAAEVKERTGLRVRVISGKDEARLMGRSLPPMNDEPTFVADLGGATTEWVSIDDGKPKRCGSLRLGAIRTHCHALNSGPSGSESYVSLARESCQAATSNLVGRGPRVLLVTGGTAKALATLEGTDRVSLDALRQRIDRVRSDGPPSDLKPARQEVLLAGLIIFERLMLALDAPRLEYALASVRDGMARRLVTLLSERPAEDLHSTLLLRSTLPGRQDASPPDQPDD